MMLGETQPGVVQLAVVRASCCATIVEVLTGSDPPWPTGISGRTIFPDRPYGREPAKEGDRL